ncbi:MAG: hypothetical protein Q9187_007044 [Circinaria calcarea]
MSDTAIQTLPLPPHDSLGLNGYMIADPHSPLMNDSRQSVRTYHPQHRASGIPISTYSEYSIPYQNNIDANIQGYESPLSNRIDSPQESKATFGPFAETSSGRAPVAPGRDHRPSISSAGHIGSQHRNGSIDESDVTSATSSREYGNRESDEPIPPLRSNDAINGNREDSQTRDSKGKAPPWSELKTKAGKERKRLPLACITCRRKKIRCSGEKPACKHCLRSRIPCVYKITTRKAAPRTDYMAMLDKRLKRMEERVIKIIPREDAGKLPGIGRANVKPPPSSQVSKSSASRKRVADQAFGSQLDDWAHTGNTYPTLQSRPPSGAFEKAENRLLTEGADHLPSKEIQEHLAEVKGEPAFLRGESWAKPSRDIALKRYDEPNITILIVLLILGLHEFGTCQGGRSWMLAGMAMRMAYALQLHRELEYDPLGRERDKGSELSFVDREIRRRTMWSCFLMDRFNSSGTERPMVINEENIKVQLPIKESNFQMEIPGPTESLDGTAPNPVQPDTGQVSIPKGNMGVASYSIRIIALWGRVIRYFNLGGKQADPHALWHPDSQYADLKKQAQAFKDSLPESLLYTSSNLQIHAAEKLANQFLFMHISYNQVVLFLHKFAIPNAPGGKIPKDIPKEFGNEAAQTALEAAAQISILINEATGHSVYAPFAGYCAFASSTVHVFAIFTKSPLFEASSKRHLAHNVKYLSKMKMYWGMFHYMAESLKDIYRQHHDAAQRGPGVTASGKQDASSFQYGDWFEKYPRGVSGTDYQNPSVEVKRESGHDVALSQKSDLQSVEEYFTTISAPTRAEPQRKSSKRQGKENIQPDQPDHLVPNIKAECQMSHVQMLHHQQHPMVNLTRLHQEQAMSPPPYSHELYTPSHPTYPLHSFAPTNLMPMPHPGILMPELDRQLVYGAYAGHGSTATTSTNTLNGLMGSNGLWDQSIDISHAMAASYGYGDVGTSAWLMPFNLNPPDIRTEAEFAGLGVRGSEGGEGDGMNRNGNGNGV